MCNESLNGTVYLKGIPFYDREKQAVALKEVDFDLKTKNALQLVVPESVFAYMLIFTKKMAGMFLGVCQGSEPAQNSC